MPNLSMGRPERVFSFEQLYEQAWAAPCMDSRNSVVCEVQRLRKKPDKTRLIGNVRQAGYRFKTD